jgi:hypothetical protein
MTRNIIVKCYHEAGVDRGAELLMRCSSCSRIHRIEGFRSST